MALSSPYNIYKALAERSPNMSYETDETSFRSFAERYIIARASTFNSELEREDAWKSIMMARSIYTQICMVEQAMRYKPETQADTNPQGTTTSPGLRPSLAAQAASAQARSIAMKALPATPPASMTKEMIEYLRKISTLKYTPPKKEPKT